MRDTVFFRQAELLLRILPLIHKEEAFALKGGTAGMGPARARRGRESTGVKWKVLNISRMDRAKHRQAVRKLRDWLGV